MCRSFALLSGIFATLVVPAVPFAQASAFTQVATIAGPVNLIEVDGNRAFLAGGKTLTVVDVSKPETPVRLGSYSFPEKIWGLRVAGSKVYVAADLYGLGIVDVSNPRTPVLRGSIKWPGQTKNVALVGNTALVADHMSGIDIVDVTDAAKPVKRDSYFLEGYARDVASVGSMAYAIDAPTGLYAFDLSKPGPLEAIASNQSARAPGSIELAANAAGQPTLAVLIGSGLLQIYDLSKPGSPAALSTFRVPSGRPVRVALVGSHAYVADARDGLQVVDLSTPSTPVLAGGFKSTQPARDVAVAGSFVYLVVGAGAEGGEVVVLKKQ